MLIPFSQWEPLPVVEVVNIFGGAPFEWCLAGGYAVELFLGSPIRPHSDIDVMVFREDQIRVQRWLADWQLYAADPAQTLRPWAVDEVLPVGVHDIWGHRAGAASWQMQLMLAETEGDEWVSRRHPSIRGKRADLIARYGGLPCLRVEVQLLYKAKGLRPKDEIDFQACVPRLSVESKRWLKEKLRFLYPHGHAWIDAL